MKKHPMAWLYEARRKFRQSDRTRLRRAGLELLCFRCRSVVDKIVGHPARVRPQFLANPRSSDKQVAPRAVDGAIEGFAVLLAVVERSAHHCESGERARRPHL